MKRTQIADLERAGTNLYRAGSMYYRLFGKGITPNGCWVIAPELRELIDIDAATGQDVYGRAKIEFETTGTVSARPMIKA